MIDLTVAQGLLDSLWQWCQTLPHSLLQWYQTRDWDLYKFSSPLVALVVQFTSRPFKRKLAGAYDRKLSQSGVTESKPREIALNMSKDWDLQVSYFATMFSAFFSIASITHAFSGGGGRFALVIAVVFGPFYLIYISVLKAELGSLSNPFVSGTKRGFKGWAKNRGWKSEADFYSFVLRAVNVLLLLLIFIFMPDKSQPPSATR